MAKGGWKNPASITNGKLGGRPVGSSTLLAQQMKEEFVRRAHADAQDLYNALVDAAKGCWVKEVDKKTGEENIYQRPPDVAALREIHDRVYGKAPQGIDLTSGGEKIGSSMKMLSPEAQERMRQLYEEDMMRQTIEGKIIPKQLE